MCNGLDFKPGLKGYVEHWCGFSKMKLFLRRRFFEFDSFVDLKSCIIGQRMMLLLTSDINYASHLSILMIPFSGIPDL